MPLSASIELGRIIQVEFSPNCYIVTSFPKKVELSNELGETRVANITTFLYDGGKSIAEWNPENGPIYIRYRCTETHPDAAPHHFCGYINTLQTSWAQMAIKQERLPDSANTGDFYRIFDVLKSFTDEVEENV